MSEGIYSYDWEKEINKLQQEKEQLEKDFEEVVIANKNWQKRNEQLQSDKEQLEAENAKLREKNITLTGTVGAEQTMRSIAEQEKEELERDNKALKKEYENADEKFMKIWNKYEQLESKLALAREALEGSAFICQHMLKTTCDTCEKNVSCKTEQALQAIKGDKEGCGEL